MWKRNRSSNLPPPAARVEIGTPTLVESTLDEATAANLKDLPAGGTGHAGGTDHARPRDLPSAVNRRGNGRGTTDGANHAHGCGETPQHNLLSRFGEPAPRLRAVWVAVVT